MLGRSGQTRRRTVWNIISRSKQKSGVGEPYQNTADDVAQMRDVVDIRQGAGDKDVLLTRDGQDGRLGGTCTAHDCCLAINRFSKVVVVLESFLSRPAQSNNGGVDSQRCRKKCPAERRPLSNARSDRVTYHYTGSHHGELLDLVFKVMIRNTRLETELKYLLKSIIVWPSGGGLSELATQYVTFQVPSSVTE